MKIHRKKDKILILILINFILSLKYIDKSGIKNTLLKKYLFFHLFLIDFYI